MVTSHHRGHPIFFDQEKEIWLYIDDKSDASVERPCVLCDKIATPEGYDPCLGYIEGAIGACCGHGVNPGYVIMEDKKTYAEWVSILEQEEDCKVYDPDGHRMVIREGREHDLMTRGEALSYFWHSTMMFGKSWAERARKMMEDRKKNFLRQGGL